MAPTLNWFITGVSSGFGYLLALHVLQQGHKVIGTIRNRSKAAEKVVNLEKLGGKCLTLDVTNIESIPQAIQAAEESFGHIDVLVNNAGYALLGPCEDVTDSEIRKQMETNFFGPLALMRAVIPSMRERKSGTIVNISSTSGISGMASCSLYSASKFALEGASEGVAAETGVFGIRTIIIQPGAFRTSFLDTGVIGNTSTTLTAAYEATPAKQVMGYLHDMAGKQAGDPEKGAARIFEVITGTGMAAHLADKGSDGKVLRVILGSDAVSRLNKKLDDGKETVEKGHEIAVSTDF